ncbi:hypothetical protein HKX48_002146, partial [Thoreauomyces humboldtii]
MLSAMQPGSWLPTLQDQLNYAANNQATSAAAQAPPPTPVGNVQCSLHGHLPHALLPKLLERLIALCGNIDFDYSQNVWEHEICYTPASDTPFEHGRNDDAPLRLRASVVDDRGRFVKLHRRDWRICFNGAPEPPKPGDRRKVTQRVIYESKVSGDALSYMDMLGY